MARVSSEPRTAIAKQTLGLRSELTCDAVGDALRYTPGSTMENRGGTWMSDEPCLEAMV